MLDILKEARLTYSKYLDKTVKIYRFDELQSTNSMLKEMAENGASEYTVVMANKQTEGRGTQGRKFFSPLNGLYMSILLKPKVVMEQTKLLTIYTAVAIVNAIKKVCGINCQIKWVNDIIYKNKKVGGILTEGIYNKRTSSLDSVVIGIGINISPPEECFPDEISNLAGTLFEEKVSQDVFQNLILEIIENTIDLCGNLQNKEVISKYRKLSILKNKNITYILNDVKHYAEVVDIDDEARLVIKENGEIRKLVAGVISGMSFIDYNC